MFSRMFSQIINSFGIVLRTFRAFFMRQIVGLQARFRRITSFSRQAAKLVPKAMSAAAVAGKKPTKREDYFETKRLFIAKSLIVIILLILILLAVLIYFLVWPLLRSAFFTGHLWQEDEAVPRYSGKVVLYYDEPKECPLFQGSLEDGVMQGPGIAFDEEGRNLYVGNYQDGEYHGDGKLYSEGELVYEGQFEESVFHGSGKLYANGAPRYEGQFDQGIFHGPGKLYEDGELLYDGQFQYGEYEGSGILYKGGALLYQGQFAQSLYHGQGKLYSGEYLAYEGGFADGLKEGAGTEYDQGALRYKGGFSQDVYEGEGALYKAGVLSYKGGFVQGLRSGQGVEYFEAGNKRHEGGYLADLYEGEGTAYKQTGGLEYVGGYREGRYQNLGTLYIDDEYSLEAEFDAGTPKGDVRIFRGGRLYYEGAAEGITPHGQGVLYASTGEAVYRGEMLHGKIDAGSLLGLSLEDAREAFMDAPLSEARGMGLVPGFTVNNAKLGVTLFCTLLGESGDSEVIYVYLYSKGADAFFDLMPWATAAEYEAWREDFGIEKPQSTKAMNLVPIFTGGVPFAQEQYHRKTYYDADQIFCAWSGEEGSALFMVEWITANDLSGLDAEEGATSGGSPSSERTQALLGMLGLSPEDENASAVNETTDAAPVSEAESESEPPESENPIPEPEADPMRSAYYGTNEIDLLFQAIDSKSESESDSDSDSDSEDAASFDPDKLLDHALNYFENAEKREIYDELIALANDEAQMVFEAAAMGRADPAQADALGEELEKLELQRNKCIITMEREQFAAEMLTNRRLSDYDLQSLVFVWDPSGFEPMTPEEIMAVMDMEIAYQELLQIQGEYAKALAAYDGLKIDYAMGKADKAQLSEAQKAACGIRLNVYSLLCAYTRDMHAYNELSYGTLSRQYHWLTDVFGLEIEEREEPEEPAEQPAPFLGGPIIG